MVGVNTSFKPVATNKNFKTFGPAAAENVEWYVEKKRKTGEHQAEQGKMLIVGHCEALIPYVPNGIMITAVMI